MKKANIVAGQIKQDYLNTIKTLAKFIDSADPYMQGHCDKVMKYSLIICKRLKLAKQEVDAIKNASLLHDIGKMGIDTSILRKAGPLSRNDWKRIHMHPAIGAEIIGHCGLFDEIVPIVKHHHARFEGGGYPDAAKRNGGIPIGARIIAVADAFDAMTSDRPYRKAMTKEEAIEELKRCSGTQFDPKIVSAFLKMSS